MQAEQSPWRPRVEGWSSVEGRGCGMCVGLWIQGLG